MYTKSVVLLAFVVLPLLIDAWRLEREQRYRTNERRPPREIAGAVSHKAKRQMSVETEVERSRRRPNSTPRDFRKKPAGSLAPLEAEDIDDEVVSVAVGPPPIRPKFDRTQYKPQPAPINNTNVVNNEPAVNLVKDVLSQLGTELLTRQVSEDFVFGQYIGIAMRNLTKELKLKMQHDVLDLLVKYQSGDVHKASEGEDTNKEDTHKEARPQIHLKDLKIIDRKHKNDTEDAWSDFTNLANVLG